MTRSTRRDDDDGADRQNAASHGTVIAELAAEREIRRLMFQRQWRTDDLHWTARPGLECRRLVAGDGDRDSGRTWVDGQVNWVGRRLSAGFRGFRHRLDKKQREAMKSSQACWMPSMMHFLTNEIITLKSPNSASGQWYSWEPATVRNNRGEYVAVWIAGYYKCRFSRESGVWRFASIVFSEVFSTEFDKGWVNQAQVTYGPLMCVGQHDSAAEERLPGPASGSRR